MTWLKLPEEFDQRARLHEAGRAAAWLHTAALLYCARELTDGYVPAAAIFGLAWGADAQELADKLCAPRCGLWQQVDGGYYVADYLEWNPRRDQKEELSQERAAVGRAGGIASGAARRAAREANTNQIASSDEPNEPNGEANDEPRIPYPVSSSPWGQGSDDRAGAGAGTRGEIIPLYDADWYDRTWEAFRATYPKGVPRALRARWPEFCPDEATYRKIMAGLAAWCRCRQWCADGNDYVTKPATFLEKRNWAHHPPAWEHAPDPSPPPTPLPPRDTRQEAKDRALALAMQGHPGLRPPTGPHGAARSIEARSIEATLLEATVKRAGE